MVSQWMLPEFMTIAAVILAAGAEIIHFGRVRKLAPLIFGPSRKALLWARCAPAMRVVAIGLLCWGLLTLMLLKPKSHNSQQFETAKQRHVVLLLDVSPSMRLVDAGPEHDLSRMKRASMVIESLFDRVPIRQYKLSVIAFYNDAIPVVVDTVDIEVVKNVLNELPMHYAFKGKETNVFAGLNKCAEIVRPWQPKSTVVLVVSDGDTVPATGMPKMPPSVANVLVVGVGDPVAGKFIAGRHSRQDVSMLRQVAARLGGEFHNGNSKQISTDMIQRLTQETTQRGWENLTRREYALAAIAIGGTTLALLPVLLHYFGTLYYAGVPTIKQTSWTAPGLQNTRRIQARSASE